MKDITFNNINKKRFVQKKNYIVSGFLALAAKSSIALCGERTHSWDEEGEKCMYFQICAAHVVINGAKQQSYTSHL